MLNTPFLKVANGLIGLSSQKAVVPHLVIAVFTFLLKKSFRSDCLFILNSMTIHNCYNTYVY